MLGVAGGGVEKRSGRSGKGVRVETGEVNDDGGLELGNVTVDEDSPKAAQPTAFVAKVSLSYSSLPRVSKEKLENLLFRWLDWHRKQMEAGIVGAASERLSGEVDVFHMGDTGEHRVWADRPRCTQVLSGGATPPADAAEFNYESRFKVPQYDRACASLSALAGNGNSKNRSGSSSLPSSVSTGNRCFNCGSYGHSVNNCTQARDRERIASARQAAGFTSGGSNTPSRYFLAASGIQSEFEDVIPGELSAETREALGMQSATEPPPWLLRMRLLGVPPGWSGGKAAAAEDSDAEFVIFDGDGEAAQTVSMATGSSDCVAQDESKEQCGIRLPGINAPIPATSAEEHARWRAALERHPGGEDIEFRRKFFELQANIASALDPLRDADPGVSETAYERHCATQPAAADKLVSPSYGNVETLRGYPRKFF